MFSQWLDCILYPTLLSENSTPLMWESWLVSPAFWFVIIFGMHTWCYFMSIPIPYFLIPIYLKLRSLLVNRLVLSSMKKKFFFVLISYFFLVFRRTFGDVAAPDWIWSQALLGNWCGLDPSSLCSRIRSSECAQNSPYVACCHRRPWLLWRHPKEDCTNLWTESLCGLPGEVSLSCGSIIIPYQNLLLYFISHIRVSSYLVTSFTLLCIFILFLFLPFISFRPIDMCK